MGVVERERQQMESIALGGGKHRVGKLTAARRKVKRDGGGQF